MSNLKLEKLTENLNKSVDFGKKIEQQVSNIAENILQTRLSMAKIEQKIEETTSQCKKLQSVLKKQQQENSAHDYKMQKIEIRLQEYSRKVQIQQNMYDKKMAHHNQLLAKLEQLQQNLTTKNTIETQIQYTKEAVKIIENKLNTQTDQIQKISASQFTLNKNFRTKQDELARKQRTVQKKKALLKQLNEKLGQNEDKQNEPMNMTESNQQAKTKKLLKDKESVNGRLQMSIQNIMEVYKQMYRLSQVGGEVKKYLGKSQEMINDSKVKKSSLIKLSQMLKLEGQDKQN